MTDKRGPKPGVSQKGKYVAVAVFVTTAGCFHSQLAASLNSVRRVVSAVFDWRHLTLTYDHQLERADGSRGTVFAAARLGCSRYAR